MKDEDLVTDLLTACDVVEGTEENVSHERLLSAWSYLISSGDCWRLQGWYGRNANFIISSGIISKEGKILKTE